MQTIHLVYVAVGAGKPTHARNFATDINAIRFSVDEWITSLFADDQPSQSDTAWALRRVARCTDRIWASNALTMHIERPTVKIAAAEHDHQGDRR